MAEIKQKTKSTNTFRFKSFAERVNEIDLRQLALYHIGHEYEELPEENETYFHQTLKKWIVLNLSEEFTQFRRKCLKIVTLPQLIHKKDYVIDVLLEHLRIATNLSLQPTLELLYVLARDLREEFYPYFQRVLDRLVCLLYTQDAEQLEWTLICLAFLFKTLKSFLKKNIGVVFHAILPLLDEQRYEAHVTNFAVECFSFIARDVKDYRRFLDFMLDSVVHGQVESIRGCGRLCFEIMRGIKGKFHSVAAEFMRFLFEALLDDEQKQSDLLQQIMCQTVQEMLNFIHPQHMTIFWQQLCTAAAAANNLAKLPQLLQMFLLAIEQREGRFVSDLQLIVPTIIKMLHTCMKAEVNAQESLLLLCDLISKLLLAPAVQLTQLDTSRLLMKTLTLPQREIYANFILKITMHAQFELLVLPHVMSHFEQHFDAAAFELLTAVVLRKRPLVSPTTGLIINWQAYPLQVKNHATLSKLENKCKQMDLLAAFKNSYDVDVADNADVEENALKEQLLLLLLLPHISALRQYDNLDNLLQKQISTFIELFTRKKNLLQKLCIFSVLLTTHINMQYKLSKALTLSCVIDMLPHLGTHVKSLQILNQLLMLYGKELAKTHYEVLQEHLAPLLSAPQQLVRQLAAHSLQSLNKSEAPYKIFYDIECIEPTVQTYREQLLLLQKLETAGEFYKNYIEILPTLATNYQVDTLRFLLGLLYHNFKLLWTPVQQLLQEYAQLLGRKEFWPIYREKLQQTADIIDKATATSIDTEENVKLPNYWKSNKLNELLPLDEMPEVTQLQVRNYRNLLWQRLPKFGHIVEMENRDLVTLFLNFIQMEYRPLMEKREFTCNLMDNLTEIIQVENTKNVEQQDEAAEIDDDEEEDEVDSENEEQDEVEGNAVGVEEEEVEKKLLTNINKTLEKTKKSRGKKGKKGKNRTTNKEESATVRSILETLSIKLGIFVVQPNPKALYRETELYSLYLELLAAPNVQLQKLALDCIMAYKWPAVMPYKPSLYAFIEEREFRKQLVQFKLDCVQPEHREQFTQILLRILYGKMLTRGAQMAAQLRKGLILRFLAQCSSSELFWFLHMAFARYTDYTRTNLSLEQVPALVMKNFNLQRVWLPQRLQSVINLLELIRKEFGGLLAEEFQLYMLKLLVFVGSVCQQVLQATPKLHTAYKRVRNAALLALVNFFAHIGEFAWTPEQVKCLTEVFIWPSVQRLSLECIHTPTPLLKLLLQWSEQPRLYVYLNQVCPAGGGRVIFAYIMDLLLNKRAKPAVRRPIMALIERLLQSASNEEGDVYGALEIIKPFIMQILERLRLNFGTRAAKMKLQQRDISILSLLTAHVQQPDTCDSLLQLLLPVLISKTQTAASTELISQIIQTVGNLLKHLEQPELYLIKLAPLFEHVQEVSSRKMLCELLTDIAKQRHKQLGAEHKISINLRETARLIFLLNAWNQRWLEQPDYDKRLDALKQLVDKLNNGDLHFELGVLVIYNCYYFIRFDKDMGLRDNALEHLCLLMPKLIQQYVEQSHWLLDEVLLHWVRLGIRGSNEHVREASLKLLGEISRECGDAHDVLRDLAPLCDKHDAEVDFFENLTHLQTHRHGRALLKFNAHAANLKQAPCVRTLTQLLLPLASRYLLSEKYASKHTLVDAAIETVGVICQLLPWQQYHGVLRYYLMKLRSSHEYQKQCVRIVVRILDGFHFDLSQAEMDVQQLQQLKKELIKMEEGQILAIEAVEKEVKKIQVAAKKDNKDDGDGDDVNEAKAEEEEDDDDESKVANENDEADLADTLEHEEATEAEVEATKDVNNKSKVDIKKPLLLHPNAAKRVMSVITTVLIPTLNRTITERSSYDSKHKLNRKRFSVEREEEEILRVPIALALVKLMQKLPKQVLDSSLPGVFIKVCTFLRSPLKSVRMLTRDILKKIMLTLGPEYLSLLMDHLTTLLTRGFQVHVLAVTVHGVLDALRDLLRPGDVSSCLSNLLEVAVNDIFGEITAEKQIKKISSHTPEAKPSAKSFLVLNIVARKVPESCLLELLMPFKQHLQRTQSRKTTLKIQQCFGNIVNGLVDNANVALESLLMFIYGTMSESIVDLLPGITPHKLSAQQKEHIRRARPDCFLLAPTPKMRTCATNRAVQTNTQANAHILIEFGLELLNIVLKRKKLLAVDYQPFVNPLLPLLRDALRSTHIRVTTFALKCYATLWHDEYVLETQQEDLSIVVQRLFEILKNFSTFGATKEEENQNLMRAVFKAIVALIRKRSTYELTAEQLDQLLLYIEQDLFEGEQQTLSFALLKALVARHITAKSLDDIMQRLSHLCIIAQSEHVREEARQILLMYVMEYTLGKRIASLLKFFAVQLCYELPSGRLSAVKFLEALIRKFPAKVLSRNAEFLYISFGTRLVNDDEPQCKRAVAAATELLIMRLEKADRQRLFDLTLLFFEASQARNKVSVREMAACLCSRYLVAEKQTFAPRLKIMLPILVARLSLRQPNAPGRFVRAPQMRDDVDDKLVRVVTRKRLLRRKKAAPDAYRGVAGMLLQATEMEELEEYTLEKMQRDMDHEIIQLQYCLLKAFEYCPEELSSNKELSITVDELAYESQKLLAHEHMWVRCNAVKIIAQILMIYDFELVGRRLMGEILDMADNSREFIYANPAQDIKSLILDLCAQVIPAETPTEMIDEMVNIFLFVANMLAKVPFDDKKREKLPEEADQLEDKLEKKTGKIDLNWLVRQMRFLTNKEVAKAPHSTTVRTHFFTLIEGLIALLDVSVIMKLAPALLSMLVRAMSEEDQQVDADLRRLALRVGSRLRKRIGSDIYDKLRTNCQMQLMMRRAERKKVIAQEKIHDPVRAAKRKAGMQDRKKAAKRIKASVMRGKAVDVKKKIKRRKRKAEDDIF